MNWKKTTAIAILGLVVLLVMTGCPLKPPATPGAPAGPDSTWTGVNTVFKVSTTVAKGNIRYIMDWANKTDTSDQSYPSGEEASLSHRWDSVGVYEIKVQAICDAEPAKASDWSPSKSVKVVFNDRPVVTRVSAPPVAVKNVEAIFTVYGSDPDNDSLRIKVDWGGGSKTDTGFFLSPCSVEVSHVFTKVETARVVFTIQDWKGTDSKPETVYVPVGVAGGVVWYWQSKDPENEFEPLTTSPVIATVGTEERLFSACEGDFKFYSIRTSDRKGEKKVSTRWPDNCFTGHPGFCAQTNHIIVGSEEGELYAFTVDDLDKDWMWPGKSNEESLTNIPWGSPAFSGNSIYIGQDIDSIFLFRDVGTQGNRVTAYGMNAAVVVDAPVVGSDGNVVFGTDSGYLLKMAGTLNSPIWRAQLLGNGAVYGPILGSDGTIYCGTDSFRLFALNPDDGTVKSGWPLTLDGDAPRPVLGQNALFVGTSFGKVYSINPATGSINWQQQVSQVGFSTSPVVAANGYVYLQDDDDVLHCRNQADGTVIWSCNCPGYLPRSGARSSRPRKTQLTDFPPNPTICANGNIIVLGQDATYCVAGYPEGPLDGAAAWPKWQKDHYNTGKK